MKRGIFLTTFMILALAGSGCGSSGKQCASGTVEQDGVCVPDVTGCAPGTVLQGSECVPACPAGEYYDGSECVEVPECAAGTSFDPDSGQCVADESACGEGSSWENGECVADLECGEGTHAEGGTCVPDRLADPDVTETGDPETPREFELPAAGESVSLGGLIDMPVDRNDDGNEDPEFDGFRFQAEAGTYLRILATSEGDTKPAFLLASLGEGEEAHPQYVRYALEPNGPDCVREFFLPWSDSYIMWVSDYANVHAYVFDYSTVPVGGPDFSYYISIENLGDPEPRPLGSLPAGDSGDLSDGGLEFFSFSGLSNNELATLVSKGLPGENETSDIYAILMLMENGELLTEEVAYRTDENAETLLVASANAEYTVIIDFLLVIGPNRAYDFSAESPTVVDCTDVDCETESIEEGETALLAWDLVPGDFMVAGVYLPMESYEVLELRFVDSEMNHLLEEHYMDAFNPGIARAYADHPMRVFMWLRNVYGNEVPEYTIDDRIFATPLLEPGETYNGLGVNEMPPYTYYPAGIDHLDLQAGRIVYLTGFETHGDWYSPAEMLLTPDFWSVGPVIDTQAWNFPDSYLTPLIAYSKTGGHYVHYVQDPNGDILSGTYDVEVSAYEPEQMGEPTVDSPVQTNRQYGTEPAWFGFTGSKNRMMEITVDPGGILDQLQPEVWIFNFGAPYFYWISYVWLADPEAVQLGVVMIETSEAKGEPITVEYPSPYDGPSLILVQDAGGTASVMDNFDLTITIPAPPSNDACEDAEPVVLDGQGLAEVVSSAKSATDSVQEGVCDGYLFDTGPEVFYSIDLQGGETIELSMDSERNASLYLFTDCNDVAETTVAASNEGNPEQLTYEVPADGGDTYLIGADFCGSGGDFTLSITVSE